MRPTCEVTVDRDELKKSWARRGRKARTDETHLYSDDRGFIVETQIAQTYIKSVGVWQTSVAANAGALARLSAKLPKTREVTLLYFEGQLIFGPVRISAREL